MCPSSTGQYILLVAKHPDGRLIIDQSRRADGSWEVRVFDNRDHANLRSLPPNTPRAVKQLYRREWRLRYLRATDYWAFGPDINRAYAAWERFQATQETSRSTRP